MLTVRAERVARNGDWEPLASERPRGSSAASWSSGTTSTSTASRRRTTTASCGSSYPSRRRPSPARSRSRPPARPHGDRGLSPCEGRGVAPPGPSRRAALVACGRPAKSSRNPTEVPGATTTGPGHEVANRRSPTSTERSATRRRAGPAVQGGAHDGHLGERQGVTRPRAGLAATRPRSGPRPSSGRSPCPSHCGADRRALLRAMLRYPCAIRPSAGGGAHELAAAADQRAPALGRGAPRPRPARHQVRVLPAEGTALLDAPDADVILVDGRQDLPHARGLCQLIRTTGPDVP